MLSYEEVEPYRDKFDYDLVAAFQYNPQSGLGLGDIDQVLAVWEGENDGDDWRWVVSLKDGGFAYIHGGCDYTGWDCQSWLGYQLAETPIDAAEMAHAQPYSWRPPADHVVDSLMGQVANGKNKTWRETKDQEFGVRSGVG